MKNPQGRLFMVIVFSLTTCAGSLFLLVSLPDAKDKLSVFMMMLGVTGLIAKFYFDRKDREAGNQE